MLVLGVPLERIRAFGESWSDGGLWDDILWLALQAWAASGEEQRRVRWHHLVMAVGNFKRQGGRRLRPARICPAGNLSFDVRLDRFQVPGRASISRDNEASWQRLESSLSGAATATTTTMLAALWPESHHILDWRVLAAVAGLGVVDGGDSDLGLVTSSGQNQLEPTLERYAGVRTLLNRLAAEASLPVRTLERALYRMTQNVQGKGMTWAQYGNALANAAPGHQPAESDGSPDDEKDIPPSAP
jgi:hypothetical protein